MDCFGRAELGSWWPTCWHSYFAAGFKHPRWSKGGDTAFQADVAMSGFATTVFESPWTSVNVGEQHFSVGMPRAGGSLALWLPQDTFPVGLGAQEDRMYGHTSLLPPDPVCDFPFNSLPHPETLVQAFAQTVG